MKNTPENKVFLNDEDIIEVIYKGGQTYASVKEVFNQIKPLTEQLRSQNKPVRIINDLKHMGENTAGSRKAAVEVLKQLDLDRIGLYGANIFYRYVANLLVRIAGKQDSVKIFNTKEEAVAWVKASSGN